jgi:predicted branched-subunit amino acid permease
MTKQTKGFFTVNWKYFWGVGVGLIIAWVTSAIAYLKAGNSVLPKLIVLEVVLSAALLVTALIIRSRKK